MRAGPPKRPRACRPAIRSRCCSARSRPRWRATEDGRARIPRDDRRAMTRNCWGCAVFISKRSGATMPPRRGLQPRKRPSSGLRWLGRSSGARLSLRRRRLGRCARCARSDERLRWKNPTIAASVRFCSSPVRRRSRTSTATPHAHWCSNRSSSRRIWCRRRRWRAAGSRKPASTRKARKILETAWAINPHPDIAESYADLRLGDSARERLGRCKSSPARCRVNSKAHWRSRVLPSMRANSRRRAPRSRLISRRQPGASRP